MTQRKKPGVHDLLSPAALIGMEEHPETAQRTDMLDAPGDLASAADEATGHDAPNDPWLGAEIGGYRLEKLLGTGAGARVYAGSRGGLRRAIKIMRVRATADGVDRARREAQVLERLSSPNVVRVFDSGVTPTGFPYHILELLEGETLQSTLRQGPLPHDRTMHILRDLATGLRDAHSHGIVHRDLKPANVMLVQDANKQEVAKILDFGLARWAEVDGPITQSGVYLGTPLYMAPEQIMSPRGAGTTADVYSLGVILFEMLKGYPPFSGSLNDVIHAHLRQPPARVPGPLAELLGRMLQKDPRARPQDGSAVLADLESLFGWSEATASASFGAEGTEPTQDELTRATMPGTPKPAGVIERPVVTARDPGSMPKSPEVLVMPSRPSRTPWIGGGLVLVLAGAMGIYAARSKPPIRPEPSVDVVLELNGLRLQDLSEDQLKDLVNGTERAQKAQAMASDRSVAQNKLDRWTAKSGDTEQAKELKAQLDRANTPEEIRLLTQRLFRMEQSPVPTPVPTTPAPTTPAPTTPAPTTPVPTTPVQNPSTTPEAAHPPTQTQTTPEETPVGREATSPVSTPRKERPSANKVPAKTPPPVTRDSWARNQAEKILSELGSSLSDVSALGLTEPLANLEAASVPDRTKAETVFRARAATAVIEPAFLKTRFERLRAKIEKANPASAEMVESEFLELRTRLMADLNEGQRRAMARKISELEQRLGH